MLTAVAFQFAVNQTLPQKPYTTMTDRYIIASFSLLFLQVILAISHTGIGGEESLKLKAAIWLAAHARTLNMIMLGLWVAVHVAVLVRFLCPKICCGCTLFRDDWTSVIAANRRVDETKVHNAVFAHYRGWQADDYTGGTTE